MPSLSEIQTAFHARVLGADMGAEALVLGDALGSETERLAVYADAYRLRLAEILGRDYPILAAQIGDEAFATLTAGFAHAHPSRHPSVRWFGCGLPEYVATTAPWHESPWLAAIAEFERAQNEISDAADDDALALGSIGAIPPEHWPRMRFAIRAAVRRVDVEFDIAAAVRGEGPVSPDRVPEPIAWLLWRDGIRMHWRSLDALERDAFEACRIGASFGTICEVLAAIPDDVDPALRAAALLKQWVTDAVLAGVELDRD